MKVTVSRKAHFNAAHKLYRNDWSDKKNEDFLSVFNRIGIDEFKKDLYDKNHS